MRIAQQRSSNKYLVLLNHELAIIGRVKKILIILMLFVMPLQATWAMAAAYCQHEEDVTPVHFGHHEHEYDHDHEDEHEHVQNSDEAKQNTSGLVQIDVHDCHGHTAGLLLAAFEIPLESFTEGPPIFDTSLNAPGVVALPERPQWLLAV